MRPSVVLPLLAPSLLLLLLRHTPAADGQELVKIMSADAMRSLHTILDADSDGAVSRTDGEAFVADVSSTVLLSQAGRIFRTMDANGDGRLDAHEFAAELEQLDVEFSTSSFTRFDLDGDGTLTVNEAAVLFCALFRLRPLDANGDGALSPEEFRAVAKQHQESQEVQAEGRAIFRELDADGDGVLDPHEYYRYESGVYAGVAAWRSFFALADQDKDGRLTEEETVVVREHPRFGGSAAYHHSKFWIDAIEQLVAGLTAQQRPVRETTDATSSSDDDTTIRGSDETIEL